MVFVDEEPANSLENERDDVTSRYLHKLAMHAKQRKLPTSLIAHYETQSWIALNSDIKYRSCEKCNVPPPPPCASLNKTETSTVCSTCGHVNKQKIQILNPEAPTGLPKTAEKRSESVKRTENSSKRKVPQSKQNQVQTPKNTFAKKSKVLEGLLATPETPTTPLLLQSSNSKKRGKKVRVSTTEEPDFLQKLFGIGATPS